MSFSWHISSLGFSISTNRLPSDNAQERKIRFKIDPFTKCQTKYSEIAHPSSIYTRFNTRYVIPLLSYTDTLFEWSQMKIIKLEFPILWNETFFLCLKQVYCCLTFVCVYIIYASLWINIKYLFMRLPFLKMKGVPYNTCESSVHLLMRYGCIKGRKIERCYAYDMVEI